jgi:hypothetical protein
MPALAVAAAAAIALLVVPAVPAGAADASSIAVAQAAAGFLAASQQADGGFELAGFPGFETPDAVLALAATGQSSDTWSPSEAAAAVAAVHTAGGQTGLDALDDFAESGTLNAGQAAKLIVLDVAPLGLDPADFDPSNDSPSAVDLTAVLDAGALGDGSFGTFNATLYAALAEPLLGREVAADTVDYLDAAQQANGGWNFGGDPSGTDDDPDTTGLAVQALVAAGQDRTDPVVAHALAYLASMQQADGSWQSFGASNPNSTAVAVLAIAAAGGDPTTACWRDTVAPDLAGAPYGNPDAYLRGLQAQDGHLASPNDDFGVNTFGTSQGVEALLRRWVPTATAAPITCAPVGHDLAAAGVETEVAVGEDGITPQGAFTFRVDNAGTDAAESPTLTIAADATLTVVDMAGTGWTCADTVCTLAGSLAAGAQSATLTVVADLPAGGGLVHVTATVPPDANPANDSATLAVDADAVTATTGPSTGQTLAVTGPPGVGGEGQLGFALLLLGAGLLALATATRMHAASRR